MVSTLTIISLLITIVLILVAPFVFFWLFRKYKGMFVAMSAGALSFFISQYLVRLPLLGYLSHSEAFQGFISKTLGYVIVIAGSAVIIEFMMKTVILRWFVLNHEDERARALAIGFGHGMFEAIFLVALTYINNVIFAWHINAKQTAVLLEGASDQQLVLNMIDALTQNNALYFLMIGFERLMLMFVHVALTILIYQGFKHKSKRWSLWLQALTMHLILDMTVVFLQHYHVPLLVIEAIIFVFVIVSYMIIKPFYQELIKEPTP